MGRTRIEDEKFSTYTPYVCGVATHIEKLRKKTYNKFTYEQVLTAYLNESVSGTCLK